VCNSSGNCGPATGIAGGCCETGATYEGDRQCSMGGGTGPNGQYTQADCDLYFDPVFVPTGTCALHGICISTGPGATPVPTPTPLPRFIDNGNQTITDRQTGLQWEKKDSRDGDSWYGNPHDTDNGYSWSALFSDGPTGSAFTEFLVRLNGSNFGGHSDWRLPTVAELATILLPSCPPAPPGATYLTWNGCLDPAMGPTGLRGYWSSESADFFGARTVRFGYGGFYLYPKIWDQHVRAVRTGP
jgi:hypothetical protein